ncbi:hypothetical protein BTN50_1190 [Candidatus Enterovibrio altilux]|uniref:Uncharacterized protein n=1 Tax=Candidatus Enterovibrio altilux TaxID=1927128 RepID=A0A291B9J5_9GAMM|nr:hypothetical protein BTN50_1190 [Candidatus Enterovibrio luxaltus]
MMMGLPNVLRLNQLKSAGKYQGIALFFPITLPFVIAAIMLIFIVNSVSSLLKFCVF